MSKTARAAGVSAIGEPTSRRRDAAESMGSERDPVLSNTGKSPSGTALEGLCVQVGEPDTKATATARELLLVSDGELVTDALPDSVCDPLGTTVGDCEKEGGCDVVGELLTPAETA